MRKGIRMFGLVVGALLCWPGVVSAQITIGQNLNMNLGGNVSVGYTGSFGDSGPSAHSIGLGGNGNLSGSYYNPKFLSFQVRPYYQRSQANSTFQSLTNSSGVDGTVNLFTGSHIPGTIFFSKFYDTSGQYAVPGITGFTTNSNAQAFGVTWSLLLDRLPSVTASYSTQGSDSQVLGANSDSLSHSRNFNLQTNYRLAGFRIVGNYLRQTTEGSFPLLQQGEANQESSNASVSESVQASHAVPLQGDWFIGWSRSTYHSIVGKGTLDNTSDGTTNTLSTGVTMAPLRRVTVSLNSNYNDNLFGTIQQQMLEAGAAPANFTRAFSSRAWNLSGSAAWTVFSHLSITGRWSRNQQFFEDYAATINQYGGNANFRFDHRLLGSLNFSVGVVDSATQLGNTGASLVSNVSFARTLKGWDVDASFDYSHQIQTLFATYMTSTYGYGTRVRRRLNDSFVISGAFRGRHSGMTPQEGSSNHSESFTGGIGYGRYAGTATYSQSSGISVLTPQGLVAIPQPVPTQLILEPTVYRGRSYGFGGSASLKRLIATLSYSNAYSSTMGTQSNVFQSRMLTSRLEWRMRKLFLNGGFTRFEQGIAGLSATPTTMNSYYIGISRWFDVF